MKKNKVFFQHQELYSLRDYSNLYFILQSLLLSVIFSKYQSKEVSALLIGILKQTLNLQSICLRGLGN